MFFYSCICYILLIFFILVYFCKTKKYQNRIFIKLFFVNVLLVLFTLILGFSSKTYNYYIELTTFVTTIIVFVILSVTDLIKKG